MTTEFDWKNAVIYAGKKYFKKGLAEGKAEGKAETAKAMMLAGEPVEKIILYSGLSKEQIEALENS